MCLHINPILTTTQYPFSYEKKSIQSKNQKNFQSLPNKQSASRTKIPLQFEQYHKVSLFKYKQLIITHETESQQ